MKTIGLIGGLISGCTEIELLIKPEDLKVPLFETTKIMQKRLLI